MVEPTGGEDFENNENEEEEDWGDYGQEDEYDTGKMMEDVENELKEEKAIAENMAMIESMQKNREEIMGSRIAKLTKWKLIDVITFSEILKKEYGEDLSKIED